jgi:hypothetical protein
MKLTLEAAATADELTAERAGAATQTVRWFERKPFREFGGSHRRE